jgi:hypothetical protein
MWMNECLLERKREEMGIHSYGCFKGKETIFWTATTWPTKGQLPGRLTIYNLIQGLSLSVIFFFFEERESRSHGFMDYFSFNSAM